MSKFNLNHHLKEIEKKGITIIPNGISKNKVNLSLKKFKKLEILFEKKYRKLGEQSQIIKNYFLYDKSLIDLVFNKYVDKILNKIIDKNYVLIDTSLTNRLLRKSISRKKIHCENYGNTWHHDSRYIGGKRLDKGFSYVVCYMFEPFNNENSSTMYIPNSHLERYKKPKKYKKYHKYKKIFGKAGSIAIMDSSVWHNGGAASENSRWSIFSMYGPWFMKPYFNFPANFSNLDKKKINSKIKKLLHFNSLPPKNELEGLRTLKNI